MEALRWEVIEAPIEGRNSRTASLCSVAVAIVNARRRYRQTKKGYQALKCDQDPTARGSLEGTKKPGGAEG